MHSTMRGLSPSPEGHVQFYAGSSFAPLPIVHFCGRYQSASEVVRTALRLLEGRERQKAATLEWLALEIQKGLDSGCSEPVTPAFWHKLRDKLSSSTALDNA
jgi:antitoxin ParD1/3/4